MEKSASKTVKLNGKMDVTITITRSITEIKGDLWECRPDETLYIENVSIDFVSPNGKKESGTGIDILSPENRFDAEWIKKGAYGRIQNTGTYLSRASYDQLSPAYNQVSAEATYPEWQAHIDEVAAKERAERLAEARAIVESAEKEIQGGQLMSAEEIKIWRRNYNNIHNEGGSGFIPHRTSREAYNHAKLVLQEAA